MKKDDVRIDGLSPTIKYYDYSNYKQVKTNDHKSQIFFRQNHNRYILVLFHFSCHKLNSRSLAFSFCLPFQVKNVGTLEGLACFDCVEDC